MGIIKRLYKYKQSEDLKKQMNTINNFMHIRLKN